MAWLTCYFVYFSVGEWDFLKTFLSSYDNEDCAVFGRFDFNIAMKNFSSHSICCTIIKSSSQLNYRSLQVSKWTVSLDFSTPKFFI
jgi:hypothetical protein